MQNLQVCSDKNLEASKCKRWLSTLLMKFISKRIASNAYAIDGQLHQLSLTATGSSDDTVYTCK